MAHDPWDWSVDDVVENLCNSQGLWDQRPGTVLPQRGVLEAIIRENDINGSTLLTEVTTEIMLLEWRVKSLGQRAALRYAVEKLQQNSDRYLQGERQRQKQQKLISRDPEPEFKTARTESTQGHGSQYSTSQDRNLSLEQDTNLNVPTKRHGETLVEDASGTKRRRLDLFTRCSEAKRKPKSAAPQSMLKPRKITTDNVFFGSTEFGSEMMPKQDLRSKFLAGRELFNFTRSADDTQVASECQFVNRRMRYFLGQAVPTQTTFNDEQAVVIFPYPPCHGNGAEYQSAIVFREEDGEIKATRELQRCSPVQQGLSIAPNSTRQERSSLKGRHKVEEESEDFVHPLYGDSDSEENMSATFLDELEQEQKEREIAAGNALKSKIFLSEHDVTRLVTTAVDSFVTEWKQRKLPIREHTAWKIWRGGRRRDRISWAERAIQHYERRLEKQKQEIVHNEYKNEKGVLEQCQSLKLTVFEIQEEHFKRQTLHQVQAPVRPQSEARIRKRASKHNEDEEDIDLSSGSEFIKDALEDFIEEDEMEPTPPSPIQNSEAADIHAAARAPSPTEDQESLSQSMSMEDSDGASSQSEESYSDEDSDDVQEIVPMNKDAVQRRQDARERQLQSKSAVIAILAQEAANPHVQDDGQFNGAKIPLNLEEKDDTRKVYVHGILASKMKAHQVEGVRFLWREIVSGRTGCLLAHTMGLGKTMQSVIFVHSIYATSRDPKKAPILPKHLQGPIIRTLVLCPPALIHNWTNEFDKWLSKEMLATIVQVLHIDSKVPAAERLAKIRRWVDSGGVLIIGYSLFRNLVDDPRTPVGTAGGTAGNTSQDLHARANGADGQWSGLPQTELQEALWEETDLVIADEAHVMKGIESATAKSTSKFNTRSRIAMTGTPLSNALIEYFSMIDWIEPGYLGNMKEFRRRFEKPIHDGLWDEVTPQDRRRAHQRLGVLIRELEPKVSRVGTSVLKGVLKPKIEFVININLSSLQRELYIILVDWALNKERRHEDMTNTGIWKWVTLLLLVCNHPQALKYRLDEGVKKGKCPRPIPKTSKGRSETDDLAAELKQLEFDLPTALVFKLNSVFKQWGQLLQSQKRSGKASIVREIVNDARAVGDRIVIFSHSLPTLDYFQKTLTDAGIQTMRIDGSVPAQTRPALIDTFNKGTCSVMLVSTTAGGTGLNVTGANRVIIVDFMYNPQNVDQAIGRCYRIGQTKPVFVYRFVTNCTFEQPLYEQSKFKTQLAFRAVDKKRIRSKAVKTKDLIFAPTDNPPDEALTEHVGKDPAVLDKILKRYADSHGHRIHTITKIMTTEGLQILEEEPSSAELQAAIEKEFLEERMRKEDPRKYEQVYGLSSHQPVASRLVQEEAIPMAVSASQRSAFQPAPPPQLRGRSVVSKSSGELNQDQLSKLYRLEAAHPIFSWANVRKALEESQWQFELAEQLLLSTIRRPDWSTSSNAHGEMNSPQTVINTTAHGKTSSSDLPMSTFALFSMPNSSSQRRGSSTAFGPFDRAASSSAMNTPRTPADQLLSMSRGGKDLGSGHAKITERLSLSTKSDLRSLGRDDRFHPEGKQSPNDTVGALQPSTGNQKPMVIDHHTRREISPHDEAYILTSGKQKSGFGHSPVQSEAHVKSSPTSVPNPSPKSSTLSPKPSEASADRGKGVVSRLKLAGNGTQDTPFMISDSDESSRPRLALKRMKKRIEKNWETQSLTWSSDEEQDLPRGLQPPSAQRSASDSAQFVSADNMRSL